MKLTIINGANLNLLGKREPEIYGNTSFEQYLNFLQKYFSDITIEYYQSNIEGEIVECIQKAGDTSDGIILNAGGYSHTSIVIADAIKSIKAKCVEVHISNLFAREQCRHHSLISAYASGSIIGLGLDGYRLAIEWFINKHSQR